MNEIAQELLKRADVLGAWLSGKVGQTVDFATQQAIDIAQQYVLFGAVYHTTLVLIPVIFLVVIWYKAIKMAERTGGFSIFLGVICSFPLVIVLCFNLKDMLLCWFAPKVWLIIQLTEMTKAVTR